MQKPIGLIGKATSAEEFVLSLKEWDKAALEMEIFHETYDFYMTPTTAMLPAKIGELDPSPFEKLAMQFSGRLGVGQEVGKIFLYSLAGMLLKQTNYGYQCKITHFLNWNKMGGGEMLFFS